MRRGVVDVVVREQHAGAQAEVAAEQSGGDAEEGAVAAVLPRRGDGFDRGGGDPEPLAGSSSRRAMSVAQQVGEHGRLADVGLLVGWASGPF